MLAKHPGFTLVAVLTLALGIGGNTMMFSVLDRLVFHPFNFHEPERLIAVTDNIPAFGVKGNGLSAAVFNNLTAEKGLFEHLGAYQGFYFNLPGQGMRPEQLFGGVVTSGFFPALGVKPILGRGIQPADEVVGNDQVVVLSHSLWARRFGGDSSVIGRKIPLEGRTFTVVGVMPEGFSYPPMSEIWGALAFSKEMLAGRDQHLLDVIGRLPRGVDIAETNGRLQKLSARYAEESPKTDKGHVVASESLIEMHVAGSRGSMTLLMAAVGLVLLIACTNVANLLMARATSRRKEIAIRSALGAGRMRIVLQLLVESVLLALLGGALGVLLAMWGIELFAKGIPGEYSTFIPGWQEITINLPVLLFTLVLSVVTGIAFGLVPALHATKVDLSGSLKEGSATLLGGSGRNRFRNALVVVEVALALVLLVGAGLLIRADVERRLVDLGFEPEGVMTMDVSLPDATYPTDKDVAGFLDKSVERIQKIPGVEAASVVGGLPMGGGVFKAMYSVDGEKEGSGEIHQVGADYFRVMRIPLLQGRSFTENDIPETTAVVVVNQAFAAKYWPKEKAVGKRVCLYRDTTAFEIIGVVGSVAHIGKAVEFIPELYVSSQQHPRRTTSIAVRASNGDPMTLLPAIERAIGEVDHDQAISQVWTMEDMIARVLMGQRLAMIFLGIFAAIALLLAAVGIYSVISWSVTQRTHEIGLRMALGARNRDVMRMMVRQGMIPVLLGVLAGIIVANAITGLAHVLLYSVNTTDPLIYGGVSITLIAVALMACYLPARRATRVDPMTALRYE